MPSNGSNVKRAFEQAKAEVLIEVEKEFKSIAFEFYARVVQGTPVDTGRAKANWGLIDSVPDSSVDSPVVSVNKNGLNVIFLYNNLPYIVALEMGHSQKAPIGWIRRVAAELGLSVTGSLTEG